MVNLRNNAELHRTFWIQHPALAFGISTLLGAGGVLWISCLWIIYQGLLSRSKAACHALLLIAMATYSHVLLSFLPQEGKQQIEFHIQSLQPYASPFQNGWIYKGTCFGAIPCSVVYYGSERPKGNCDYLLSGTLQRRDSLNCIFKAKEWKKIEGTWSLAELRFLAKERLRSLLQNHLHYWKSAPFLTALFTGDLDNRELRYDFSHLGLQHILAISGFHFSTLIFLASLITRRVIPSQQRLWLLFFLVILYFLFVGDSPSVFRSACTLSLFLIGQLLHRRTSGLNLLGASLFIELLLQPFSIYSIGFQLSFLSCFGILLFHPPLNRLLEPLFPSRSLQELKQFSLPSQCASILVVFFKNAISITLAVNFVLWPFLLFHMHRFPLLSLLYNLFVPAGAALCLSLFLFSLLLYHFMPLLSLPLWNITDYFTAELLEIVSAPPAFLDFGVSISPPSWFPILYLSAILGLAIELTFRPKYPKQVV